MRKGHLDPKCCCLLFFPNHVDDTACWSCLEEGPGKGSSWVISCHFFNSAVNHLQLQKWCFLCCWFIVRTYFCEEWDVWQPSLSVQSTLLDPNIPELLWLPLSGQWKILCAVYAEGQGRRQKQAIDPDLKLQKVAAISLGAETWWISQLFSHLFSSVVSGAFPLELCEALNKGT